MNSQSFLKNKIRFENELIYLGGQISTKSFLKIDFVDLEVFFLNSTNYMCEDSRLSRCMEYWAVRYGNLLSPKRMLSLLKGSTDSYNPQVLGALLSIADRSFPSGRFSKLMAFCKDEPKIKMFSFLSRSIPKDERWSRFGIEASIFRPGEEGHFLATYKGLKDIPIELKNRMMGIPAMKSNLFIYRELHPGLSMYKIGKDLKLSYAFIHRTLTALQL